MGKLKPDALAESGDDELDARDGVQAVDAFDVKWHVIETGELPAESADPFATWLDQAWNDWNEDGTRTIGEVIAGALAFWRGQ